MKTLSYKARQFFSCGFTRVFYIYVAFVVLFLALAKMLSKVDFIKNIDLYFQNLIFSLRGDEMTVFMKYITMFGDKEIVLPFSFVLLLYLFLKKRYDFFIALLTSSFVSAIIVYVVKNFFQRERPSELVRLIFADGFSFPSGHAMVAIAFYGILAYFVFVSSSKAWEKYMALFLGGIFMFLIGFSRVYLGVHFPTDIVGSFILGGVWISIVMYFTEKIRKMPT